MSEDARRDADDGHVGRHMGHDDGARADDGAAADGLLGNDAGATSHEDSVSDFHMARDIALGAQRSPITERGIVADRAIEVHEDEFAQGDVGGEDGARADDRATSELHPRADQGLRMHEGQELSSGGEERSDQFLLQTGHADTAEIDAVGRRAMTRERTDGGEVAEWLQGLGVVIEEAGDGPSLAAVGMLAGPGVTFATEAACTDDEELFHVQVT